MNRRITNNINSNNNNNTNNNNNNLCGENESIEVFIGSG